MTTECLFSVTLRDEALTTFVVVAQSEDAAISALEESSTAGRDQVGRVDMLAGLEHLSANIAPLLKKGARVLGSAPREVVPQNTTSRWPTLKELRAEVSKAARNDNVSRKLGPTAGPLYSALEAAFFDKPCPAHTVENAKTSEVIFSRGERMSRRKLRVLVECGLGDGVFIWDDSQFGSSSFADVLQQFGVKVVKTSPEAQPPMPPLLAAPNPGSTQRRSKT